MKRTIFNNINEPYSLHDMNINRFDVEVDMLTIRTQSGMVRVSGVCEQVDGHIEIHDVDWDFSYAYVYEDFCGNAGSFSGKKMFLKDFINDFRKASLSVIDTNYGYNRVCYSGYLSKGETVSECAIEIYHLGDMVFCEQINKDNRPMKEVILSADGDLSLYSVPADVADNLVDVCNDFAINFVWHGGKSGKFLRLCGEQYVAFYTEQDFIDYLNEELYPQLKSEKIKTLGSFDVGVPEEYERVPRYNF